MYYYKKNWALPGSITKTNAFKRFIMYKVKFNERGRSDSIEKWFPVSDIISIKFVHSNIHDTSNSAKKVHVYRIQHTTNDKLNDIVSQ